MLIIKVTLVYVLMFLEIYQSHANTFALIYIKNTIGRLVHVILVYGHSSAVGLSFT